MFSNKILLLYKQRHIERSYKNFISSTFYKPRIIFLLFDICNSYWNDELNFIYLIFIVIASLILIKYSPKYTLYIQQICSLTNIICNPNRICISHIFFPNSHFLNIIRLSFYKSFNNLMLFNFLYIYTTEYVKKTFYFTYNKLVQKNKELESIINKLCSPVTIFSERNFFFSNLAISKLKQPIFSDKEWCDIENLINNSSISDQETKNENGIYLFPEIKGLIVRNGKYELHITPLIYEKRPCWMGVFHSQSRQHGLLNHFDKINKNLSKTTNILIKNMETDYNKWSNLQTLKYIKESDMATLALCVTEANLLQSFIYLKFSMVEILLEKIRTKNKNFNIRNLILQCLEIISVFTVKNNAIIRLKYEECFPDKVTGDYKKIKQVFLSIFKMIFVSNEQKDVSFLINCFFKRIENDNKTYLLEFEIQFPKHKKLEEIFLSIINDKSTLFENIMSDKYDSPDFLMLNPVIRLLGGKLLIETEDLKINKIILNLPLEPFSDLSNSKILNNKLPYVLTFCRTKPDMNNFCWKPKPPIIENTRKRVEIEPPKIPPQILYTSQQIYLSQEDTNKSVNIDFESSGSGRKKGHSIFSMEKQHSNLEKNKQLILEDLKENCISKHNSNSDRNKKLILEDLKDLVSSQIQTNKKLNEKESGSSYLKSEKFNNSIDFCFKSHESLFKRCLLSSLSKVIQENFKQVELEFKDEVIRPKERRLRSMVIPSRSSRNLSPISHFKTPQCQKRNLINEIKNTRFVLSPNSKSSLKNNPNFQNIQFVLKGLRKIHQKRKWFITDIKM